MRISEIYIERVGEHGRTAARDQVAVEEPLEIRLVYWFKAQRKARTVAVTMRTPGHDAELALGFLVTEGVVRSATDVLSIHPGGLPPHNEIQVELAPEVEVDWTRLERHFYTASSCGVCGKTSLDALEIRSSEIPSANCLTVPATLIQSLPAKLRAAQEAFDQTGGLHAAGLFDAAGDLQLVREDVGRHNALDKIIGASLQAGKTPLAGNVLLLSGRASFELLQKSLSAGIPVVAAVGAPSSLAVELAERFQITLLGFVRGQQFNVYTCGWRISS